MNLTRFSLFILCLFHLNCATAQTWQEALAQMPLGTGPIELVRSNCVPVMLTAFQSNQVVKALIFMPGATDEFNMFHRARAAVTNSQPSLLDAVNALTNQSLIRVTFHPPFLLLHSDEDPLEPVYHVNRLETAAKIQQRQFLPHALFIDRDWDSLLSVLAKTLRVNFSPLPRSRQSWHFYRHSFAAWNLDGWQALEAVALAGKTQFTVAKREVIFEGDERIRARPKVENFIR